MTHMTDNTETVTYSAIREQYDEILRRVTVVAEEFEALLSEVGAEDTAGKSSYNQRILHTLKERADSELLSIAFFGEFSAGKTFLISGLIGQMEYFRHGGLDQYATLLPTSPRHTSNCPVAVEPLPAGKRENVFSVLFEDAETWEQKRPVHVAIIGAYASDLPGAAAQRVNKDRTRKVLVAKLEIASSPLKARLYDLPGFSQVGVNFENTIQEFLVKADCIVYVASAEKPINEKELDMLRDIYNHHKITGKPVFFVLTKIDKNKEVDPASGHIQWEEVQQANNEFLETYFRTQDGKADRTFIGHGFVPSSAAQEAKGRFLAIEDLELSKSLIKESRMNELRGMFNDYLQNSSGPLHLAELTAEIQKLLARLSQDISSREISESTPLEEARSSIKGFRAQRSALIEGKSVLEDELLKLGNIATGRAFAGSDPDDLAKWLEDRLATKIRTSDVLSEKIFHEIETEKANIVREWLGRDANALVPRWSKSWESFVEQSTERMHQLFERATLAHFEAVTEELEGGKGADISSSEIERRAKSQYEDHKVQTLKDTLEVLSTTWKTWTVVAGVGATGIISSIAAAAAAPTLAVLGPIGFAILATAGIGAAYGKWKLSQQRQKRQEELLIDLPIYSRRVVSSYRDQASEFVRIRIGLLMEAIDNEIDRLSGSINSLEQRLVTGEYVNRTKRLETLNQLSLEAGKINSQIGALYSSAAALQPAVSTIFSLASPS